MKTGVVTLNDKQFKRLDVLNKTIAGYITEQEAAEILGISKRQVQRLKKGVREHGAAALIHGSANRKPSHALTDEEKQRILIIREKPGYRKANFKHFAELLEVEYGIRISYSALYRLLKGEGINSPKTRRRYKPHRRRKRRPQAGSLIQIDASPYDWFGTGRHYSLHGAIDDATGQVVGLYLCQNECLLGYHEVIRRMVTIFGVPEAVYADRHTIFRSPNEDKAKAEETSSSIKAHETQFGRAMGELKIAIIAARSPQAKGRIERLWGTLQSRLPVEFEIKGIRDIDTANAYLSDYIFSYNSEFAVEPADSESSFLTLDEKVNLDYVLCVKEERVLDHGQVFSYKGKRFQIANSSFSSRIPPKARVTVMVSPYIGIVVSYLNYAFATHPAGDREAKPKAAKSSGLQNTPAARFVPGSGMPWKPGLPSYRETLEIVSEIFNQPYAKPGADGD
jgi:transposase